MKNARLLAALTALLILAPFPGKGAAVATFSDIAFWVGTGSKQAALVIDWKDGRNYPTPLAGGPSIAWGFRWNGTMTGKDMFLAIAAADPRLRLNIAPPATQPGGANTIYNIGYDLDGDGFTFMPGAQPGFDDAGVAGDGDDHYKEGWFAAGFWSYWRDTAPGAALPAWSESQSGFHVRALDDGSWDAWTWAADYNSAPPEPPVAAVTTVPEPTAMSLNLVAMALAGCLRLRRSSNSATA